MKPKETTVPELHPLHQMMAEQHFFFPLPHKNLGKVKGKGKGKSSRLAKSGKRSMREW